MALLDRIKMILVPEKIDPFDDPLDPESVDPKEEESITALGSLLAPTVDPENG